MVIKSKRSWELSEAVATPESVYMNRRQWLKAAGFTGLGLGAALAGPGFLASSALAAIGGYPFARNEAYTLDRAITDEEEATTYTNFYEFGSSKNIWKKTRKMKSDPWAVTIDGMVEAEMTLDATDLVDRIGGTEERLYRHRCVEAWSMAVPGRECRLPIWSNSRGRRLVPNICAWKPSWIRLLPRARNRAGIPGPMLRG